MNKSINSFSNISNCPMCSSNDIILYYCGECGDSTERHYEVVCNDCSFCIRDNTEDDAINEWEHCAKETTCGFT